MVPESVSYVAGSTNDEQKLDLFLPSLPGPSSLVVFIHGGAWRTGDRRDHHDLAKYLCHAGLAVAVIDYRLSIEDAVTSSARPIHPVHSSDIISALDYLGHRARAQGDIPTHGWTVVGHSVGAWLALSALYTGSKSLTSTQYPKSMLVPPQNVIDAISTSILVDGIYSVTDLLKEYPDYQSFVAQAFLPHPAPADYTRVSLEDWKIETRQKSFHVWHSRDDELLSFKQSVDAIVAIDQATTATESRIKVDIPVDGLAASTTVQGKQKLVRDMYPSLTITSPSQLSADFSVLRQGHDELLHTTVFWEKVITVARRQ